MILMLIYKDSLVISKHTALCPEVPRTKPSMEGEKTAAVDAKYGLQIIWGSLVIL